MHQSIQRQQGHAAVMFMLMFPLLLAIFALGVDGSKAMQDKARIEEASEVASLALTAQNSTDESVNIDTANKILKSYLPEAETQANGIERLECEENPACDSNGDEFVQYTLAAQVESNTWFSASNVLGETYTATGGAIARKIVEQEEIPIEPIDPIDPPPIDPPPTEERPPIDLVFSLDFSGSMSADKGDVKYQVEKLISFLMENPPEEGADRAGYSSHAGTASARATDGGFCRLDQAKDYGNIQEIIDDLFIPKDSSQCVGTENGSTSEGEVNLDSLSTNFFIDICGSICHIFAEGTASWQGVIRAAQLMDETIEPNPRRVILIFSDGQDNSGAGSDISSRLYNAGLCDEIKSSLNTEMYAFLYRYSENLSLETCVGKDNIYTANNSEELYELFKAAIVGGGGGTEPPPPPPPPEPVIGDREEIGHLF